jgi:hypothetical protein
LGVEVGGSRQRLACAKSARPYLKNKLKQKWLGTQLKCWSDDTESLSSKFSAALTLPPKTKRIINWDQTRSSRARRCTSYLALSATAFRRMLIWRQWPPLVIKGSSVDGLTTEE